MKKFPLKTKDTVHRVLADEAIIVNFKDSYFYSLNPVGTFIWEHCDGQHSLEQIAAALAAEYKVTSEAAAVDCREYIESLVAEGLLEWREDR